MSENGFYRAFEERYRGSRELIHERLGVYMPFVEPLLTVYSEAAAVDLGCGRGEWLELMADLGLQTVGIDVDEGMLSACVERRLNVVKQEATAFLKSLPDESQCVVSGFHIVEHIPFPDLQVLVVEALRVLKPGGLLILETPNPENVVVGSCSFYLDPTHQRPIPPLLLEFLPMHYGFERVKILRLQEAPALAEKEAVELIDVFLGVSPDYSIVAQKAATAEILEIFDEPFSKSYGIELGQLACRLDAKLDRRFETLETRIANPENVTDHAERVLNKFAALHERLLEETVRAERSDAKAAIIAEQLLAANTRLGAIESEVAATRDRAAQFESRAVAAETRAGELECEISEAKKEVADSKRTVASTLAEIEALEIRATRAEVRVQELEIRVVGAETLAKELEHKAATAEAESAVHASRAVQAEETVAEVGGRFAAEEARWQHDKSLVRALHAEREELQRAVAAAQDIAHYWRSESDQWHQRLLTIHRSNSWRITAPVRAVKRVVTGDFSPVRRAAGLLTKTVRGAVRSPAVAVARIALKRPKLRYKVSTALRQYPGLRQHLVLFVRNAGLMPAVGNVDPSALARTNRFSVSIESQQSTIPAGRDLSDLSANARRVYSDLKVALEQKKRFS